jgi:hypothetical protein
MMAMGMLIVALADASTLSAVRLESEDGRAVVRLVTTGLVTPHVDKDGRDIVVILPGAHPARTLVLPEPVAEIEALTLEDKPEGARVRIRLGSDLPYELKQEAGLISVAIRKSPALPGRAPADVRELYAKILPPPAGEGKEPPPAEASAPAESQSQEAEGIRLGFFRLRPSVVLSYIDADTAFLDTPQPVRDQYFQIEPHFGFGIGARLPGQGRLQLTYEPRFRAASSFAELRHPTHLATLSLEAPIGPTVTVRASHHYARGLLETAEVDPGREYFFRLAPFIRHQTVGSVVLNPGGLFGVDLTAGRDSVRIDEGGFFDHRLDTLASSLNYQFGAASRLYLRYQWDHVPTPAERPLAESRASTVWVGVAGEFIPLMTGELSIGFRALDAPGAGEGGRRYHGTVATARLKKEFTPATSMTFTGRRETYPSAFEDNAFYVSTGAGAEADLGLPLSLIFHGGIAWQRNAYGVAAAGLGVPRRDDLVGWAVGLGRSLTRWAFLRGDYRDDRRRSNLAAFETHGHVFMVELGIGYVNASPTGLAASP